jgi:hypothetical protein
MCILKKDSLKLSQKGYRSNTSVISDVNLISQERLSQRKWQELRSVQRRNRDCDAPVVSICSVARSVPWLLPLMLPFNGCWRWSCYFLLEKSTHHPTFHDVQWLYIMDYNGMLWCSVFMRSFLFAIFYADDSQEYQDSYVLDCWSRKDSQHQTQRRYSWLQTSRNMSWK